MLLSSCSHSCGASTSPTITYAPSSACCSSRLRGGQYQEEATDLEQSDSSRVNAGIG